MDIRVLFRDGSVFTVVLRRGVFVGGVQHFVSCSSSYSHLTDIDLQRYSIQGSIAWARIPRELL